MGVDGSLDGSCVWDGRKGVLTTILAAPVPKAYSLLNLEIGQVRGAGFAWVGPEDVALTAKKESLGRRDVVPACRKAASLPKSKETRTPEFASRQATLRFSAYTAGSLRNPY